MIVVIIMQTTWRRVEANQAVLCHMMVLLMRLYTRCQKRANQAVQCHMVAVLSRNTPCREEASKHQLMKPVFNNRQHRASMSRVGHDAADYMLGLNMSTAELLHLLLTTQTSPTV
eukprot:scpid78641/ scgid0596/ 